MVRARSPREHFEIRAFLCVCGLRASRPRISSEAAVAVPSWAPLALTCIMVRILGLKSLNEIPFLTLRGEMYQGPQGNHVRYIQCRTSGLNIRCVLLLLYMGWQ